MSSWLDNIAAHGGVVEEEDEEEEQPQKPVVQPAPKVENKAAIPANNEKIESSQPENTSKSNPSQPNESKTQPSPETKQSNSNPQQSNQPQNNQQQKEQPAQNQEQQSEDQASKYTGAVSKDIHNYNKSLNSLLKRQEFLYVSSMLKVRSGVDFALEKTSKPIQTIGGLGKISIDAKSKYEILKLKVMAIQPICTVKPKSQ
ncbi:hypothetical protein TRFO_38065 [Tritrichomonas foetus]|uniref:Uncharacterized protein n=1 Tax=Tritrichomonas foetus TaxID=1144522 RepID=A0A1J4JEC4_9EUKA|nr:hypothetical protein TRFO_38065 [Tritrichomonas foetus]|eukprot:OHS95789.1 hypothetical protein TRFO_38065 [Tritrichomonas foetus]